MSFWDRYGSNNFLLELTVFWSTTGFARLETHSSLFSKNSTYLYKHMIDRHQYYVWGISDYKNTRIIDGLNRRLLLTTITKNKNKKSNSHSVADLTILHHPLSIRYQLSLVLLITSYTYLAATFTDSHMVRCLPCCWKRDFDRRTVQGWSVPFGEVHPKGQAFLVGKRARIDQSWHHWH